MYGLEKKKVENFVFDLEKEIKSSPTRCKEILDGAADRTNQIKQLLRAGASEKEFEQLGLLLHGYTALQKVLRKAAK